MVQTNLAILPFYRNCIAALLTQAVLRYVLLIILQLNAFSDLLAGYVICLVMTDVGSAYYTEGIYRNSKKWMGDKSSITICYEQKTSQTD
jgi:hypothetical protein